MVPSPTAPDWWGHLLVVRGLLIATTATSLVVAGIAVGFPSPGVKPFAGAQDDAEHAGQGAPSKSRTQADAPKDDLDRLQGIWTTTKVEGDARLDGASYVWGIRGKAMTITARGPA